VQIVVGQKAEKLPRSRRSPPRLAKYWFLR
jgi:hypothetical protein